MPVVILAVVLSMLSKAGRRMDRLAKQTLELVERAEQQLESRQPPQKEG